MRRNTKKFLNIVGLIAVVVISAIIISTTVFPHFKEEQEIDKKNDVHEIGEETTGNSEPDLNVPIGLEIYVMGTVEYFSEFPHTSYLIGARATYFDPSPNSPYVDNIYTDGLSPFDVEWSSSDETVFTISSTGGHLRPHKVGTAILTAEYMGVTAEKEITVTEGSILALEPLESEHMVLFDSQTLEAIRIAGGDYSEPQSLGMVPIFAMLSNDHRVDISMSEIEWSSSNPSVATFDAINGMQASSVGTTVLTAAWNGFTTEIDITVVDISVCHLETAHDEITHIIGTGNSVNVNVVYEDMQINVSWSVDYVSDDDSVVTVGGIFLNGLKEGETIIHANFYGLTLPISVIVVDNPELQPITSAFTDPTFLAEIRQLTGKPAGPIYDSDVNTVTYLNLYNKNISSLAGIEYFTSLESLNCSYNNLTGLDISNNAALTELTCCDNSLTALDISNNTALFWLDCCNNNLSALDVSQNPALINLSCSNNNLSELDISNNAVLEYLFCSYNNLSALDVSEHTELKMLYCSNNDLTNLDVSNTSLVPHGGGSGGGGGSRGGGGGLCTLDCAYNYFASKNDVIGWQNVYPGTVSFYPQKFLILGDANCDGLVTMSDADAILQHILWESLWGDGLLAADVDGDESVTYADVMLVYQYAAGIITEFPDSASAPVLGLYVAADNGEITVTLSGQPSTAPTVNDFTVLCGVDGYLSALEITDFNYNNSTICTLEFDPVSSEYSQQEAVVIVLFDGTVGNAWFMADDGPSKGSPKKPDGPGQSKDNSAEPVRINFCDIHDREAFKEIVDSGVYDANSLNRKR